MLMDDIRQFPAADRRLPHDDDLVRIDGGFPRAAARFTQTLKDFECGLMKSDPEISPSQIYAYAALKMGIPYANGAPHLTTDMPALLELARERQRSDLRQGLSRAARRS